MRGQSLMFFHFDGFLALRKVRSRMTSLNKASHWLAKEVNALQ